MKDDPTLEAVLNHATKAHALAAGLAKPNGLLAGHHERQFVDAIDTFTDALGHLSQSDVARVTADQRKQMSQMIDGIVGDVERFMASHGAADAKRLERNRHLVEKIYELRQAFESIARGMTPDPGVVDVRWEEKMKN